MGLTLSPDTPVEAWGRLGRPRHLVARPRFVSHLAGLTKVDGRRIPSGARRSYGDVGQAAGDCLIDMQGLDRLHGFDPETGLLRAQAGVTLQQIIETFVPRGFFPPVVPGTKFVTLGGAIANDVHGKNQRRAGTFGRWVTEIQLLRSDGILRTIRPGDDLFAATVGGLGLTGIIVEAVIRLQKIDSAWIDAETAACRTLDELCDTLQRFDERHEFTVAWLDCTNPQGRGIVSGGDWSSAGDLRPTGAGARRRFPTDRVGGLLNPLTLRAFNTAYFHRQRLRPSRERVHFDPFFFPLDKIDRWNRLYGPRGFYQYQALFPAAAGIAPLREAIRAISDARDGSFLAVLKSFGAMPSPGLLSFPAPGLTLALDFSNRGGETLALLDRLDGITAAAGGRLYAAKDARASPEMLRSGYPNLTAFERAIDPAHGSDFWRRVTS